MHELDYFFNPRSVVLIGASEKEGSVGKAIATNLIKSAKSIPCFLVNPNRDTIFGHPCVKQISDLKPGIDLAIVATPAKTVPSVMEELGKKNIKACVIISAGFKELGPEGEALEKQVIAIAKKNGIKVIGPNCLGIMNPLSELNATFASQIAKKGSLAFISQSGAFCTAVLDFSFSHDIGFSAFISIGSMADVEFADLITYYGEQKNTSAILIYMETCGQTEKFLEACRKVSPKKPVIILKAGKTDEAAKAAASHTGSLAGSDAIFDAAIEEVGALRARSITDLFNLAQVLDYQPLPKGNELLILTNAGGPSVLATDGLILSGGKLASLNKKTLEELNIVLPEAWSHSNPIDLIGDAGVKRYLDALDIVTKHAECDGILVVLSPQDMTDPIGTAKAIIEVSKHFKKPIYASFMGASFVDEGIKLLKSHKIPNFPYPDMACETFSLLANNRRWAASIQEKASKEYLTDADVKKIKAFLHEIKASGRTILTEIEAKQLLEMAHFPVTPMRIAKTKQEAADFAEKMHFPVVLKLNSHTITHKSDVGGVKLNLKDKKAVEIAFEEIQNAVSPKDFEGVSVQPMILNKGYELILGSSTDPQFGPVLLTGLGGTLVEIFKDTSLALPPLTRKSAEHILQKTKIYTALLGYRGKAQVKLDALFEAIVRFSELISKVQEIEESDINPLCASETQIIALDARFVIKK
jgi:acetyltransferase